MEWSRTDAGEITNAVSLGWARDSSRCPAAEHSAHGLHLNNVIAKRLGISAGD
jgi:hypothetical protein